MRVLIVDDEAPARALLREYLALHADTETVGESTNGYEAVKQVAELRPDLLLLDIQMPKLSGFEVLELLELREARPAVVFITAHDEHALHAFEVHAVDYLLKPVSPERFAEALDRVRTRLGAPAQPPLPATALAAAVRPPGRALERVLVREDGQILILPVESIDFVEAKDDYVSLRSGGRRHRKQQTLSELEEQLDPRKFVRIHRSILLNVERLVRLDPYAKDSFVAILADGSRLPVSRAGRKRLAEVLGS